MAPHEISMALDGLASRWEAIGRNDMTEDGEKIEKKKKKLNGQ